jgi:hypothetical protein
MPTADSQVRKASSSAVVRMIRGAARIVLAVLTIAIILWAANGIRFLASPTPRASVDGGSKRPISSDPLLALANEGAWTFRQPNELYAGLFPSGDGARVLCEKLSHDGHINAQLIRVPIDLTPLRADLHERGWKWEDLSDDFQPTTRLSKNNQSLRLVDFGSKKTHRIMLVIPDRT